MRNINGIQIVDEYICPITQLIMRFPVLTGSGKTYEREAIENWFRNGNITDPVTKTELSDISIMSNECVQTGIMQILQENPQLIIDNEVYFPTIFLVSFREAVLGRNIKKMQELVKTDIRLLICSDRELIGDNPNTKIESIQINDYTGFQFICEYGTPDILAALMDIDRIKPDLYGHYNIIKYICDHSKPENYNPTVLHLALTKAVIEGQYNFCQALLAWGADIRTTLCTPELGGYFYNDGREPLHWAVAKNHSNIAELLLNSGANHDAINTHGWRPIHMLNSVPMLRLLREHNVDIKAVIPAHNSQYGGWTALHAVAHGGHLEVAKALLACAPELVKQTSGSGDTPLHVVQKKPSQKFEAMAALLVKCGANVRAVNRHGFFALGTSAPNDNIQDPQAAEQKIAENLLGVQGSSATRKIRKYKLRIGKLETEVEQLQSQIAELMERLQPEVSAAQLRQNV